MAANFSFYNLANVTLDGSLRPAAKYDITSDVGQINLLIPQDAAFRLDARSDVGDIQLAFPLAGQSARQGLISKEAQGTVGTSPTTDLHLRSRVGNIRLGPQHQ